MSAADLQRLLDERDDLWRGARRRVREALPSGHPGLDAAIGGGWPAGRLTELVPARIGSGELGLLLPALAAQSRRGLPVVLVAPPLVPCPQALAAAGLDLGQLLVLRLPGKALWAAEQCLNSRACGALVVWPPPGRVAPRAIRRLRLAAEGGTAPAFVCYHPGQQPPASLATLRLALRPGEAPRILRGGLPRAPAAGAGSEKVVSLRAP